MRAYERLLNYVVVHTASDEFSETTPTTQRQFDLANMLVPEMKELGIEDARVSDLCCVYGTLPATPGCEDAAAIGLIAHLDTVPDFCGDFPQRLRGGGEGAVAVKGIKDHQNIKVYAHMKLSINLFSLLYLSAIIKASE